jgi:transcriptional regulator with XRE-family HTH domain
MADKAPSFRSVLADNIAAERARRRLNQTALAARMTDLGFGWIRQTVTEVEKGTRRVTAEEVLGLAVAFAVPVDVLFYPRDEPEVTLPGGQEVAPAARPPRDLSELRQTGEVIFAPTPDKREPEPDLPPRTVNLQTGEVHIETEEE